MNKRNQQGDANIINIDSLKGKSDCNEKLNQNSCIDSITKKFANKFRDMYSYSNKMNTISTNRIGSEFNNYTRVADNNNYNSKSKYYNLETESNYQSIKYLN